MEKYGTSPAMMDLPKVKADNKNIDFKKQKYLYKIKAKKDKRTKSQLLFLLDATEGFVELMIQRQINPPVVIAPDCEQYKKGYDVGWANAISAAKKNRWWRFW